MNILLFVRATLPVTQYGGTERVIWDLSYALHLLGHKVTILAGKGSVCDWAHVVEFDPSLRFSDQVPQDIDIVHFNSEPHEVKQPYIITQHGNSQGHIDPNTVFVSKKHAQLHGAQAYVHNGLNWDNYPKYQINMSRSRFHFLGKAAWRVKNVQGAIDIAKDSNQSLDVLGGFRFNFKMGLRLTFDRHVRFLGMVDDNVKAEVLSKSKGLIFPVTWHEPFGLAIIESLYYGAPVFATPYGSLTELVIPEVGFLSRSRSRLVDAVNQSADFDPSVCRDYATDMFNANVMARNYLKYYEEVLNGQQINQLEPHYSRQFKNLPFDS